MPQGKRKRKVDGACMLFPDEEQQDEGISKVVTAPESLSKAWEKCGEGFDGYKARKSAQSSEKKTHALHHLEQSFISEDEISVSESLKDPGDIIWSDSDLSNDGSREPSKLRAGKFGYNDATISAAGYSGDDSPQIDLQEASDIDRDDKSSMAGAAESAVEISDSESSTSDVSRTLPQCDVEAASEQGQHPWLFIYPDAQLLIMLVEPHWKCSSETSALPKMMTLVVGHMVWKIQGSKISGMSANKRSMTIISNLTNRDSR